MNPGMDDLRLLDGACIADALVEAEPRDLAAVFGEPVKLADRGELLVKEPQADVIFFAASWPGTGWSVVEAVGKSDDDHILTLLRQAAAALGGQVLQLPPSYENGLGVAQELAKKVKTRAVCVWGSDEWRGVGGGAQLDAAGSIVRACNMCGLADLTRELTARKKMLAGEDDEDTELDEEGSELVIFEGGQLSSRSEPVIDFLDGWFKELGATQPMAPPSLWGEWKDYGEVWGARKKSGS
jgi:hypothetical protein